MLLCLLASLMSVLKFFSLRQGLNFSPNNLVYSGDILSVFREKILLAALTIFFGRVRRFESIPQILGCFVFRRLPYYFYDNLISLHEIEEQLFWVIAAFGLCVRRYFYRFLYRFYNNDKFFLLILIFLFMIFLTMGSQECILRLLSDSLRVKFKNMTQRSFKNS